MSFAIPSKRLRPSRQKRNSERSRRARKPRRARLESLEDRRLLALLGIDAGVPLIISEPGNVAYNATTNRFSADAQAFIFQPTASASSARLIGSGTFELEFEVDETGAVTGGVPGDDFTVTGSIDLDLDGNADYSGTLITGEVVAFGFQDNSPTSSTDSYDLRLSVTGGSLVADFFTGKDIGLEIGSENGSFNGVFTQNFGGQHKSEFGPIDPIQQVKDPRIEIEKCVEHVIAGPGVEHVIDFNKDAEGNDLAAGTVIDDEYSAFGVSISVDNNNSPDIGMIFDTANPTGGDTDLATPGAGANNDVALGNVLIISEDGDSSDPDDEAAGGVITFSFDNAVRVDELNLLDIDQGETGGVVTVTTATGTQTFAIADLGNNSTQTIAIGVDGVTELTVALASSGAVSGLKFTKPTFEVDCKDADTGPGPSFSPGDDVTFNYEVTNPGDVPLTNIVVTDDNATPDDNSDDFNPTPIESGGFNVGDANQNDILEPGEVWLYTATVMDVLPGQFTNKADVVGTYEGEDITDHDPANYAVRGIEIEKLTNGVDADTPEEAVEIAAGDTVTWTYVVTNTGAVPFDRDEIEIVDDAGTPDDPSDDFSVSSTDIALDTSTDDGGDNILSPGEIWEYTALDVAADLSGGPTGDSITIETTGNDPLDGPDGNSRIFTADGVSVRASAYSSATNFSDFEDAYLGRYSSGLGVTDTSEGDGSNSKHRVDNIYRFNYILFEFSETVVVDKVFLDSVVHDSDATFWVGSVDGAFTGDVTLDAALLNSLVKETNNTTSSSARFADFNGGQVAGNVLVVAASVDDHSPEDKFKVRKVKLQKTSPGIYHNIGTLITEHITDSDPSNYVNPEEKPSGKIGNFVWNDYDRDGQQDPKEPGIPGVTVQLLDKDHHVIATTTTDADGIYNFTHLEPGDYKVKFVPPEGFVFSPQYRGKDADNGSNANPHTGKTDLIHLSDHECDNTIDGGLYEKSVDKMFEAEDYEWKDSPWKVYHSSSASGGEYIKAANGTGSHYNSPPHEKTVKYNFSVHTTGNYELSARVLAKDYSQNSLWLRVNGGSWVQWHMNTDSNWQWETVSDGWDQHIKSFHLEEGNNMLEVRVREDGTKIDKWMVSKLSANTVVLDVADTTVNGDWVVEVDQYGNEYLVASNNAAHYSAPPEGSELSFNFHVDHAGVFKMHALVSAADSGSNSFWVQIDDGAWIEWHLTVTDGEWEWQTVDASGNDVDFHLGAGSHTLKIKVREGGAKLSKIVITDDDDIDLTLYG